MLAQLVRPNQFAKNLNIVHNWGDVIFYNVSTIIKLYGFRGTPFILPYQVPLRIGITEFLRQLGDIEECALTGKGKGTLFPNVTIAHQFIITKGGWVYMDKILAPYHMATAVARTADPKGFYNEMFKKRAKCAMINHIFNFPEDIIRNVAKIQEQEVMKEKWLVYKKTLDFIWQFDSGWDPLKSITPMGKKIDTLMNCFQGVFQTLNEKKEKVMKDDPEKARQLLSKHVFAKGLPPGRYVVQKKTGYNVVIPEQSQQKQMDKRGIPSTSQQVGKQKEIMEIPDSPQIAEDIIDSPPPSKRKRLEERPVHVEEEYSPSTLR